MVAFMVGAAVLAACTVALLVLVGMLSRQHAQRKKMILARLGAKDVLGGRDIRLETEGFGKAVIGLMVLESQRSDARRLPFDLIWGMGLGNFDKRMMESGLFGTVTLAGFKRVRALYSLGGLALGMTLGFALSDVLGALLGVAGFVVGFCLVNHAVDAEIAARANAVERDLSQMAEIIVLGLRSGLSFDRSFAYYQEYFQGSLSRTAALVQTQWTYGLLSRSEGLAQLARSYDSVLLGRVVESIDRSLRFGTSLTSDLSDQAVSVRASRKSTLEERVAKAPVKMLLPVGTMILPAMLILVIGPILLQLMGNF